MFNEKVTRVADEYVEQYRNGLQIQDFKSNVLLNIINMDQMRDIISQDTLKTESGMHTQREEQQEKRQSSLMGTSSSLVRASDDLNDSLGVINIPKPIINDVIPEVNSSKISQSSEGPGILHSENSGSHEFFNKNPLINTQKTIIVPNYQAIQQEQMQEELNRGEYMSSYQSENYNPHSIAQSSTHSHI